MKEEINKLEDLSKQYPQMETILKNLVGMQAVKKIRSKPKVIKKSIKQQQILMKVNNV